MALNFAHNVAVQANQPVLIFSLEMSKEQLVDRLLSIESGVVHDEIVVEVEESRRWDLLFLRRM